MNKVTHLKILFFVLFCKLLILLFLSIPTLVQDAFHVWTANLIIAYCPCVFLFFFLFFLVLSPSFIPILSS